MWSSFSEWAIVILIIVLLFGARRIPLLAKDFSFGFIGTLLVMVAEVVVMGLVVSPVQVFFIHIFLKSFLVAGLIEEGFKFLVFRGLIYDNKEFNEPYDGIVYAVMISLGFAAMENILYLATAHFKLGLAGVMQVGTVRAMLAVPAHAFFAAIMGYYLGLAKFSASASQEKVFLKKALWWPVAAHGAYDFFILSKTAAGVLYLLMLFIFCWNFVLKAVKAHVESSRFKE